jgi:two-component system phosphate regulon sensor histidine kinase PhoR
VLHTYGASRWPRDSPGIIGYIVNLEKAERTVLPAIVAAELDRMPRRHEDAPRVRFSLFDQAGGLRHGSAPPPDVPAGRASFDLAFFPRAEPTGWFAGSDISLAQWTVVVTSDPADDLSAGRDYIYVAVLGLILMALVCATLVNRQSSRLSRLHADFVGNVTHQLRRPLAVLAAASETLEHERLRSPEKVSEYAALLGQHTAGLTRIVDRVLRLSQIESGATTYRRDAVDLVGLVRDSVGRFSGGVRSQSRAISFAATPGVVTVYADASAIDDVVTNLLDNAAKYTSEGGRIDVGVSSSGPDAVVRVVDDGIGIERRDIKRIFKRFYRGSNQGAAVKGFGVGLAVVDAVVRAHDGEIPVDSEPGRGSRFEIVLPRIVVG